MIDRLFTFNQDRKYLNVYAVYRLSTSITAKLDRKEMPKEQSSI